MKRTCVCIMLLAFCMVATGMRAFAEDEPAAMILKVSGPVKVQRGERQKQIPGKFPLKWGDKVIAASGASAVVLFSNGKKETVTGTYDISEGNAALSGKINSPVSIAVRMAVRSAKKDEDLKAKGGVGGAVRAVAGESVILLSYRNTSTLDTHPVFAWRTSAPASQTTLILSTADGDEVWKGKTSEQSIAYPSDRDPLKSGGEYTVEIRSNIGGETANDFSTFNLLEDKEAEEVRSVTQAIQEQYPTLDDAEVRHLLLAQYYKQKQLYTDAVNELKSLIALDPNDSGSYRELAAIYSITGNRMELEEVQKKLEQLEKDAGSGDGF